MKLVKFHIDHFKNILNSEHVEIEPDVTCVVGKNESGKTAVLHALHRFNPAQQNIEFKAQRDYPAWLEKQHSKHKQLNDHTPIQCVFSLDADEISLIERSLGKNVLKSERVTIGRTYGNEFQWEPEINEHVAIAHMLKGVDLKGHQSPTKLEDVDKLIETLGSVTHDDPTETEASRSLSAEMTEARDEILGKSDDFSDLLWELLNKKIPKFFYFDEYSQLPGSVKIRPLLEKPKASLTSAETTARALLDQSGAEKEFLLNTDYDTRKRELENVANSITTTVLNYWSTNSHLRTLVDITLKTETTPQGQQQVMDELKIRLYDDRHMLSLPFEERSTGFRWFFSFLAAFSPYENAKRPVIILLDEPGLGLHARAQADFLRFIDERLSGQCQVVYSTHSPFMVQPGKLHRVRLVQDDGRDVGSRVTADVLSHDRDTLFPLQAALGYDLAQHLFIAPHNLIVEGTSDFTYIRLVSDHLIQNGRVGLDPKWSIIPVGGADVIPSFVALLGRHLEVTVLIDSRKEGHQRLQQLMQQKHLKEERLVAVGEFTDMKIADIEDLFNEEDYIKLFNAAFGTSFTVADLDGGGPIVGKCARLMGQSRYDHGRPATVLLKNYAYFLPEMSEQTFDRFEALFKRVNATL